MTLRDALSIEIWRAPTPLPEPVLTPAGPFDTFFHLVVVLGDGTHTGWGCSAMPTEGQMDAAALWATRLVDARPLTLDELLEVEEREAAWSGTESGSGTESRTERHAAASAVSLAAWDLMARRQGKGCADLWGRRGGAEHLDCYASGCFVSSSIEAITVEARAARDAGYRKIKIRVGLSLDEDLERLAAVRVSFPEPGSVAVDAVNGWTPDHAMSFVASAGVPLLWVEDPTPYDCLGQVRTASPLAAGESLETVSDLELLRETSPVEYLLLDVQRLGGPMRFLAAARALGVPGTKVGGHIATPQTAHLLACVEDPLPVEVFDWSDVLVAQPLVPGRDGRLAVEGPGFGVTLDRAALEQYGEPVFGRSTDPGRLL